MTNTTRKIATALGIAGIIVCGSVATGATSADAAPVYGNGNENDIASYNTGDAYGAVRSGSAWNENDCVLRDDSCDRYVDADGDGVCDDCKQNVNGSMSARCGNVGSRNYVNADDNGVYDNYASRHDGEHHQKRHVNCHNGYEHGQGYQHRAHHR